MWAGGLEGREGGILFVKASLIVWVIIAFDQSSIITDKARNEGRFAREGP